MIDPFASAVQGMDENSSSIAMPIAGLESVSKANGVTFVMVHHLGHANDRSRGSSAIEAAFGANAIVSKVDGNGRENHRLVTPRKRNRYGTDAFEVIIHDLAEDGSPWVLTTEKRRKGEVSYAVRVVAKGAPPRTTTGTPTKDERRTERIQAKALKLRDVLADKSGPLVKLNCRAARSLVGCNGNDWVDVLDAAQRLGVRLSTVGRTTQLYYDFPKSDRPAPFRPKRDAYHVIPEPYPR